jgi:hypothetical protein
MTGLGTPQLHQPLLALRKHHYAPIRHTLQLEELVVVVMGHMTPMLRGKTRAYVHDRLNGTACSVIPADRGVENVIVHEVDSFEGSCLTIAKYMIWIYGDVF